MSPEELQLHSQLLKNAEQIDKLIRRRIPANLRSHLSHEDVRQEVWVAAHKKLPRQLLGDEQAVLRWLVVVSRRKLNHAAARAYAKKRGGNFRRVVDDYSESSCVGFLGRFADETGRTPSSQQAALEGSRAVRVALASLPDGQLQAVCMRHFEGRSREEIAARLGRSKPAVNSLLDRGMQSLRSSLGDPSRYFSDAWAPATSADPVMTAKPRE